MSTVPRCHLTLEDYLEIDSKAEIKSEYFRGEMFAMAGGSPTHAIIAANLAVELRPFLRGKPCVTYSSDLRVKAGNLYTYPDLTVVCGGARIGPKDTLQNPAVLFEVLSPSTEAYDRGRKFEMYRHIESLQAYVLVSQDRMQVDVFTKTDGAWALSDASGEDGILHLVILGAHIPLASLYENVDLGAPQQALE